MSVTLTGDNNYTGTYDDIQVLGGANYGDTTFTVNSDGDNVYLMGNLQQQGAHHAITTDTSGDIDSGTWNTTATGDSSDTLVFGFNLTQTEGQTHNFLTEAASQDYSVDTDQDADLQSHSDDSAWNTNYNQWLASLGNGYTLSDSTTIETTVPNANFDPDVNITLDVVATSAGQTILTADHTGASTILGFALNSDHVSLDGDSQMTQALFDANFTVSSTQHTSANNNTVNDTTISFNGGGWSVDLYGVDSTAIGDAHTSAGEQALQTWAWANVIQHA